jgi:hypothetical protein
MEDLGCTATANLGSNVVFVVYLIFVFRHLHLSPGVVGLIFAVGCPPSAVAGRGHHLSPLPVQLQAEPWS